MGWRGRRGRRRFLGRLVDHLRVLGELERDHGVARGLERDGVAPAPAGVLPREEHAKCKWEISALVRGVDNQARGFGRWD